MSFLLSKLRDTSYCDLCPSGTCLLSTLNTNYVTQTRASIHLPSFYYVAHSAWVWFRKYYPSTRLINGQDRAVSPQPQVSHNNTQRICVTLYLFNNHDLPYDRPIYNLSALPTNQLLLRFSFIFNGAIPLMMDKIIYIFLNYKVFI